jgi:hypothetical protein
MGRAVLFTDVRLHLDDPGDPPPRGVVANDAGAEQPAPGVERRSGEEVAELGEPVGQRGAT